MVEEMGGATQRPVIIVKLGGSSITDKTGYESLKAEGLKSATEVIAKAHEAGLGVIVVHGAGSFGHPQAKKYQVNGGWSQHRAAQDQEAFQHVRYGFAATRASVLKLSGLIVQELVGRGLPATPLAPCGVWANDNGKVVTQGCAAPGMVCELLALGLVPVLHGDAVLDHSKGCSILSGDTIIRELARAVPGVARVVFLTDVAGVFDKAPDLPDARLLTRIAVDDSGEIVSGGSVCTGSGSKGEDVTGGMKLKLGTAIAIQLDHGGRVPVFICDVSGQAAARACLDGHVGQDATLLCKEATADDTASSSSS